MRVIFYNALFILVGIVALEIVYGAWINGPDFGAMKLQRNVTYYFSVEDSDSERHLTKISRDSYAFRGNYPSPRQIDILTLGGSTTAENHVDDKQTWSYRLGEKLTAASSTNIYVANAGVDGMSTVGLNWSFENWFPEIPDLSPKLVIVYGGINDARITDERIASGEVNTLLPPSSSPIKWLHSIYPTFSVSIPTIMRYFKNHSALFRLYRMLTSMFMATVYNEDHSLGHTYIDYEQASWTPWAIERSRQDCSEGQNQGYLFRLDKLVGQIRVLGAEPVLITQTFGDVRKQGGGRIRYLTRYGDREHYASFVELECLNSATMDYCVKNDLFCFDLAQEVYFQDGDHYDRMHTTPQGSERIATAIMNWILDDKNFVETLGISTNIDRKVSP